MDDPHRNLQGPLAQSNAVSETQHYIIRHATQNHPNTSRSPLLFQRFRTRGGTKRYQRNSHFSHMQASEAAEPYLDLCRPKW